jgi:hypothetical protein
VDADLSDADLDGASLAGADCTGADLRRSRALGIGAEGIRARGARFEGSEWRRSRLVGADLEDTQAVGWRLDGADLSGARLGRAVLDRAVLDDAAVDGTDLTSTRLVGAALVGVRGHPRIEGTNLEGADLRIVEPERFLGDGVRLAGARFRMTDSLRLEAPLTAAGWRPSAVERLAQRVAARPTPASTGVGAWLRKRRSAVVEEREVARKAAEAERDAAGDEVKKVEADRRRREVEEKARAELRAVAVRRAMATRVATEKGARRVGAWIAQLGDRSRTWKDAIVGRPEEGGVGEPEGGLEFPVVAELRDQGWQISQAQRDDRIRGRARAARAVVQARARIEAEERARLEEEERVRAEARWAPRRYLAGAVRAPVRYGERSRGGRR